MAAWTQGPLPIKPSLALVSPLPLCFLSEALPLLPPTLPTLLPLLLAPPPAAEEADAHRDPPPPPEEEEADGAGLTSTTAASAPEPSRCLVEPPYSCCSMRACATV